jgi:hypothetical protein
MSTLTKLELLEAFMRTTTLRGAKAMEAFNNHPMHKGMQTIPVHEPKVSTAAFCARMDRELAEARFYRKHGYARSCFASFRDIVRIEKTLGEDCDTVVDELVRRMEQADA